MKYLVTGGAGFIGSNFINSILAQSNLGVSSISVLDKLTYAGSLENLEEGIRSEVKFFRGDICDESVVVKAMQGVDIVVNFAAESHVDRSIESGRAFASSNFSGTQVLLESALKLGVGKFLQVSTDEVYGSVNEGTSNENDALLPNSPYAATKAAADLLVRSYVETYSMDIRVTRCVNNYGPNQHPEKFLPMAITNIIEGKKISVYGQGINIREWISVRDHCLAIEAVLKQGKAGEIYNIGTGERTSNLSLAKKILEIMEVSESNIEFIEDRKGHDLRYAVNSEKIKHELGFEVLSNLDTGLVDLVKWYKSNTAWWKLRKYAK
jgi:dTDP-glucose 4,6-dehydratase